MTWRAPGNPATEFEEALRYFKRRQVLRQADALAIGLRASQRAFWVGGGLQLSQVKHVFRALGVAIKKGLPFEEWRERVRKDIRDDAHAETVFRNALQQAYNAGRLRQLSDPKVLKSRPYWLFDAVLDSRTTPTCTTRNGVTLRWDNPWWKRNWPPLHHRCRSAVRSLRKSEAVRRGITRRPPKGGDVERGWGRLPDHGATWRPKRGKGRDSDRLVDALEVKARKPKPRPKLATRKRKPADAVPIRARAAEVAKAARAGEWSSVRDVLDLQIKHVAPGATCKDVVWARPNGRVVQVYPIDNAAGLHNWDGQIDISEPAHRNAIAALDHLAAGRYDAKSTWTASGETILRTPQHPLPNVSGLHVLLHESAHGHSRLIGRQYRGPVAVLEEVGVELTAREALASLNPHARKWVTGRAGAYDAFIEKVEAILDKSAPSLDKKIRGREHFRRAFSRAILSDGPPFARGQDYRDAIIDELSLPAAEARAVRSLFDSLLPTHLQLEYWEGYG